MRIAARCCRRLSLVRRVAASALLTAVAGCAPALAPAAAPAQGETNVLLADGFTALGTKDGVTIYDRRRSSGLELAAEGDLPASPGRIERVLLDYPAHRRWQSRLAECKVLGSGVDWLDVYERLSLPMIDDRDYTLHVQWGLDGQTHWMKFKTTRDAGPPPIDDVVRVATHEGSWQLVPFESGTKTHARYRFRLDIRSDLSDAMGGGQAQADLVDLFAQIAAQLEHYP